MLKMSSVLHPQCRGMYGAHLAEVLGGGARIRWLLMCTAKIDLQWLLSAVPSLTHTRVVLVLHGRSPEERWERVAGLCSSLCALPHDASNHCKSFSCALFPLF